MSSTSEVTPPPLSSPGSADGIVTSTKRNGDYWRPLECEASLIVSVLGLFNENEDAAANHMFPTSWSGLRMIAMHLYDEITAMSEEHDQSMSAIARTRIKSRMQFSD